MRLSPAAAIRLASLIVINIALQAPAPATATTASRLFFNWYDNLSPGFSVDNIHVVNPGGSPVSGTISMPNAATVNFQIAALGEGHYSFPAGTRGGPVTISAATPVLATQRVTYMGSFTEVPASSAADALTDGYFPWYDNASVNMVSDNVHLLNPGPGSAAGQVQVTGQAALPFSLAAGGEAVVSYPKGVMGGPVHLTTTSGAVIVSKRSAYAASVTETLMTPTPGSAAPVYLPWYDNASWGFQNDHVHVVNAGGAPASVHIAVAGQAQTLDLAAGAGGFVSFPGVVGGPVVITSPLPIVGSQRFLFQNELIEAPALPASAATSDTWLPWYDRSSAGMSDDIHFLNPGAGTSSVDVSLAGGAPNAVSVGAGQDVYFHFPAGTIGGPVHVQVTSGPPVIVSDRSLLFMNVVVSRTLPVPYYHQLYSLSCEEAALRMALAFQGVNVSEDQILADEGIDYRRAYWDSGGALHWGDPYANFVGDPNGSMLNYSGYGTYHSSVARAARDLGGRVVTDGEGIAPGSVYQSVLDGHPVIAWVAFDWRAHTPTYYSAFDGRVVQFGYGWEHAVTVIGVRPDAVLVNNPWSGQQWVSKPTFEASYASLHNMAVILS